LRDEGLVVKVLRPKYNYQIRDINRVLFIPWTYDDNLRTGALLHSINICLLAVLLYWYSSQCMVRHEGPTLEG
jgi:hypothetical protein